MNRTVGDRSHAAITNVSEDISPLSIVIVRVQVRVFVVLDAKVVPTHSQVKGQAVCRFPRILEVGAEFMIAVAPGKNGWPDGEGYRTARNWSGGAAREFPLWVDGRLKLPQYAVQETLHACAETCSGAQGFDGFLVRAETPVISDVGVVAAETERVPPMDRAKILVSLNKVLWAPERDGIAGCEGRIARHGNQISLNRGSRSGIHIQGRTDRIGPEWLEQIQPVENNLRLAG